MQQEIKSIVIITPDDWHLHLRESPIIDKVFPNATDHKLKARTLCGPKDF